MKFHGRHTQGVGTGCTSPHPLPATFESQLFLGAAIIRLFRHTFERLAALFVTHELSLVWAVRVLVALSIVIRFRILNLRAIVNRTLAVVLTSVLSHARLPPMLKVVHVTWEDPCFAGSGWMAQADFEAWVKADTAQSDSVGILVYETDSFIVLLQSIGSQQVADGLKISRSAIRSIKELASIPLSLDLSSVAYHQ